MSVTHSPKGPCLCPPDRCPKEGTGRSRPASSNAILPWAVRPVSATRLPNARLQVPFALGEEGTQGRGKGKRETTEPGSLHTHVFNSQLLHLLRPGLIPQSPPILAPPRLLRPYAPARPRRSLRTLPSSPLPLRLASRKPLSSACPLLSLSSSHSPT